MEVIPLQIDRVSSLATQMAVLVRRRPDEDSVIAQDTLDRRLEEKNDLQVSRLSQLPTPSVSWAIGTDTASTTSNNDTKATVNLTISGVRATGGSSLFVGIRNAASAPNKDEDNTPPTVSIQSF